MVGSRDLLPGSGAFICAPNGLLQYFTTQMPASVVQDLDVELDVCIARAELWSQGTAIETWAHVLQNNSAVPFCGSSAALGALIRGSSTAGDLNWMAGCVWEKIALIGSRVWWEYVAFNLNVADPLSRGCTRLAVQLGASGVEAKPMLLPDWVY